MSFFYFTGIDFKIKTVELQGKKIKLQIWWVCEIELFSVKMATKAFCSMYRWAFTSEQGWKMHSILRFQCNMLSFCLLHRCKTSARHNSLMDWSMWAGNGHHSICCRVIVVHNIWFHPAGNDSLIVFLSSLKHKHVRTWIFNVNCELYTQTINLLLCSLLKLLNLFPQEDIYYCLEKTFFLFVFSKLLFW